jgi:hypothetical protein
MSAQTASFGPWVLLTLGVCAGIVSGMLGVGSGTVIIPALVLVLSIPQKSAQGMCLAAMIPMVTVGALRYKLNTDIDVSVTHAALIAIGGVAGAFVGVEIATRLPGSVLRRVFACFLIAVGMRMLLAPGGRRSAPLSGRSDGPSRAQLASRPAEEAPAAAGGQAPPGPMPAPTAVGEDGNGASRRP